MGETAEIGKVFPPGGNMARGNSRRKCEERKKAKVESDE